MPSAEEQRALIQALEKKLGCSLRTFAELLQFATQTDSFQIHTNRDAINNFVRKIGIPANLKGYDYIQRAMEISMLEESYLNNLSQKLYPKIAEEFGNTPSGVERAIRYAIRIAFEKGDINYIDKVFGYQISSYKCKPTNAEFMATCVDFLRNQHN